MIPSRGNYIDGAFVQVKDATGHLVSVNPAKPDETVWEQDVSTADVPRAVDAARRAFPAWRKLGLEKRAELLKKLVFAPEIATSIAQEAGKALWEAKTEIAALKNKIDITLSEARKDIETHALDAASQISHHPHGAMAVLGPFNFPLSLSHGHVIPALLTGNTVVLKPSEITPGVAQLYAEAFHAAGFPPGVFNLVQGAADVGQALATHEDIRGILFTGSYAVGRALQLATIDQPQKILALEMGGKNATVVFPDCNEKLSLYEVAFSAFVTTGQRCTATSRLIVVDDGKGFFDRFSHAFTEVARALVAGDPMGEGVFMGPLVSQRALDKFDSATRALAKAGKELLAPKKLDRPGYFATPQVVMGDESELFREEIFGPSVALYRAKDEADAMRLANDTPYGLALSIFTADRARFDRCLDETRAGIVNWNKGTVGATGKLPFGGVGKSGNFRPAGNYSVRYCTYPTATVIGEAMPASLPPGFNLP